MMIVFHLLALLAQLLIFFAPLLLSVTTVMTVAEWGRLELRAYDQQVNQLIAAAEELLFRPGQVELPDQEDDHGWA